MLLFQLDARKAGYRHPNIGGFYGDLLKPICRDPATEVMLLDIVALRGDRRLEYDATNIRIMDVPSANEYLSGQPRREVTTQR